MTILFHLFTSLLFVLCSSSLLLSCGVLQNIVTCLTKLLLIDLDDGHFDLSDIFLSRNFVWWDWQKSTLSECTTMFGLCAKIGSKCSSWFDFTVSAPSIRMVHVIIMVNQHQIYSRVTRPLTNHFREYVESAEVQSLDAWRKKSRVATSHEECWSGLTLTF